MEKQFTTNYYVYIVADKSKELLEVGITVNLEERLQELSAMQQCKYLVYYESFKASLDAIKREMKLAAFSRWRLKQLVAKSNPEMDFLNYSLTLHENKII